MGFYWSWCYAHRLELACKEAFVSPLFTMIQEMLLRLYYLYEKSPKKSRELACIVDNLKEIFDLPKGGNLPVRCQGTRWISHKRKALQRVIDRYGTYIAHLNTLVEDTSIRGTDRERLKGYLKKWKRPKVLIGIALYIEVLKPASILSLSLQCDDADIVFSIESILKAVKSLQSLSEREPGDWPTLKSRIDNNDEYQGHPILPDFDTILDQCAPQALADLNRLKQKIKDRLQWSDMQLLRSILVFLETQSWCRKEDPPGPESEEIGIAEDSGIVAILQAVEHIISIFRAPLEAKGMCVASIQDELEEVVDYARKYLPIGTVSYRKIWFKLHTCPDSVKWPNVRLLSELLFSLPFSTSRVEQIFSRLKLVKTKLRTKLNISSLQDLLEICIEGPPLASFDVSSAIDLWWKDVSTTRRPNQQQRKDYRPRETSQPSVSASADQPEQTLLLDSWDEWLNDE